MKYVLYFYFHVERNLKGKLLVKLVSPRGKKKKNTESDILTHLTAKGQPLLFGDCVFPNQRLEKA